MFDKQQIKSSKKANIDYIKNITFIDKRICNKNCLARSLASMFVRGHFAFLC